MATITEISSYRRTGENELHLVATVTPNATNAATATTTNYEPFWLEPGQTLLLEIDNGGGDTVTFAAVPGSVTSNNLNGGIVDQIGLTLTVNCHPYPAQLVTFVGAVTTAALAAAEMNEQLVGCRVEVVAGPEISIISDIPGTAGDVTITAGTSAIAWDAAVGGTGDVANIHAVTALEVVALVRADTGGATTNTANADGSVTIKSATTGILSEVDITGGTGRAALGLAIAVSTGTAGTADGYVTGGEPLDLTPWFNAFCYGAKLISGGAAATNGYKFGVLCNPATPITATSTTLVCHVQVDPADAGGADVPLDQVRAALNLAAFPTVWEFVGY